MASNTPHSTYNYKSQLAHFPDTVLVLVYLGY
jgi:hypothetical protein